MIPEGLIQTLIFLAGVIFTAGGMTWANRKDLEQKAIDISRIGTKQRDEERANLRRHFNMALMQVAAEDDRDTRFKIAGQLKED
jgi:uncharacterized membrane protein YhiD involved in acid resistance